MKHHCNPSLKTPPPCIRAVAWLMIFLQISVATPFRLCAGPVESKPARASRTPLSLPAPASKVVVNRTVPPGATAAAPPLNLSAEPTEEALFAAAVLPEPLVAVGRRPTTAKNRALARALRSYRDRHDPEDVSALNHFLANEPDSPWRVAVLVNLGLLHLHAGRLSQTFPAWEEAWRLGRGATELRAKALVDRAAGELAQMYARVGRQERLQSLLAEIGDRPVTGSATEMLATARRALWTMEHEPARAFLCGALALERLLASENATPSAYERVLAASSGTNGFSLRELHQFSRQLGLQLQPARRTGGAAWPLPAIVHWKVGHYAALVSESEGKYLVSDPTFGLNLWVSRDTLEQEASGYGLVREGALTAGWSTPEETESANVFGRGYTPGGQDPNGTGPSDPSVPPSGCSGGMAIYNAKALVVSLHIEDTPVGYTPPRGPAIRSLISYNQREANQPANYTYANFGPKWTFGWVSYVTDNPASPQADATVYLPGGGTDQFFSFNPTNNSFAPQIRTRSVLTRTSATSYRLTFPDGSQHEFAWAVGVSYPRKVFLTRMVDPRGNGVDLFYDVSNRLTSIRDAIGQVSTISYELPSDIYKVTKISDPFGRFAQFQYDTSGRLTNITDVIGINSGFAYQGSGDFIEALTTPYGTSRFRSSDAGGIRWLEMTDPQGATERVESRQVAPGIAFEEKTAPVGMMVQTNYQYYRNTFYWDKKAFHEAAGDYSRAKIFHWLHDLDMSFMGRILESEKSPLENRVWYNYPNQLRTYAIETNMVGKPSKVGRVLDDGSTQLYQYEYNDLGNVTKQVDPMGRTTVYTYATNLIDLLEVRQTAGANEILETRTYNAQHLPLTVANGSGHTNRYTYNAAGQLLTAKTPRNDTTTYNYDTNGYLLSIDGPLAGTNDTTSFTYDGYGRIRTVTDSEGYTLTYDYDALDRRTRTTYPDGTYEEDTYNRLDRVASRDRNGRVTQYGYDANRHLISVEDPLQRTTRYDWCSCGQMSALIDPMGRTTKWHRDIQGRVTAKEYVDGSQVRYAYETTTSRLKTTTDEKGQVKVYDYLPDNNVWRVSYLNAENPTPTVTFSYDGPYNRIKTMTDGIGLTTYGYHPASTNGGRLAWVDGPLPNDTVTYDYDELGRVKTRAIDGVSQTWAYDAAGRMTVVSNVLGAFTNTYAGATFRLAGTTYPNGQWTDYAYYGNVGDHRLREIHHKLPGSQTLSRFEYAYDPAGQITNWLQQAGADAPENWAVGYDAAQQLLSVVSTTNGVVNKTYGYAYDAAGNRLFEEINGVRRNFTYNALNEIQMADDGSLAARSYQWDGANRLVGIVQGTNRNVIAYDGEGRYVRILHQSGSAVLEEMHFVWCENGVCEVRHVSGGAVRESFFAHGHVSTRDSFFYVLDHLNSVRDVRDSNGNPAGRYAYDPFGNLQDVQGPMNSARTFTGHYLLANASLLLTRHRPYAPSIARWLNRDPIMEIAGLNLFAYLENSPINKADPIGLAGHSNNQEATEAALAAIREACQSNPGACGLQPVKDAIDALGKTVESLCKENPVTCAATAAALAAAAIANGYPKPGQEIKIPLPLPLPKSFPKTDCSLEMGGKDPTYGGIKIGIEF